MNKIQLLGQEKASVGLGEISVAVLEDESNSRVINIRSLESAFGKDHSGMKTVEGGIKLPQFISSDRIRPFLSDYLLESFKHPKELGDGSVAVPAMVIYDICEAFISMFENGAGIKSQFNVVMISYRMMASFARVGIVAIIDEATGYPPGNVSTGEYMRLFNDSMSMPSAREGLALKSGIIRYDDYIGFTLLPEKKHVKDVKEINTSQPDEKRT